MKKLVFGTVAMALSVALSLLAGEAMVRLAAPQDLTGSWLVYGPRGLVLNRADWTARHQRGPTVVHYRINADHHRGPDPDPGALPVLVLGDSFTFGWLLDEPDTYVGRLQARLDQHVGAGRVQLRNAAVGGWGTGDQLAYLEELAAPVKPKLVMLFVSFDDFPRAERWPLYRLESDGTLAAADLSARRNRVKMAMQALPGYSWAMEHSHLLQLVRVLLLADAGVAGAAPVVPERPAAAGGTATGEAPQARLAAALFARIKAWCDAHDAELLVVTTGWPGTAYPWLPGVMARLGIDFADLGPVATPPIEADLNAHMVPGDSHPNAAGAKIIAEAAWPHLERRVARLLADGR